MLARIISKPQGRNSLPRFVTTSSWERNLKGHGGCLWIKASRFSSLRWTSMLTVASSSSWARSWLCRPRILAIYSSTRDNQADHKTGTESPKSTPQAAKLTSTSSKKSKRAIASLEETHLRHWQLARWVRPRGAWSVTNICNSIMSCTGIRTRHWA